MATCELCGTTKVREGDSLCDGCWELSRRIERAPEMARKVLRKIDGEKDGFELLPVKAPMLGLTTIISVSTNALGHRVVSTDTIPTEKAGEVAGVIFRANEELCKALREMGNCDAKK